MDIWFFSRKNKYTTIVIVVMHIWLKNVTIKIHKVLYNSNLKK